MHKSEYVYTAAELLLYKQYDPPIADNFPYYMANMIGPLGVMKGKLDRSKNGYIFHKY
jgi:hypothetical protein